VIFDSERTEKKEVAETIFHKNGGTNRRIKLTRI